MPEKKPPLEGWRKMIIGIVLVATGVYVGITGDWSTGLKLIGMGAAVFVGGNIADKIVNNKK